MIKRLFNIIQANVRHQARKSRGGLFRENYSSEDQQCPDDDTFSPEHEYQSKSTGEQQLVEDLAYFGLKPPSSLKEVTIARNREMLKFHPDKFASDSEKSTVANEIALIYNAAYERLKEHYNK